MHARVVSCCALSCCALAACHVTRRSEITRPQKTDRIVHREGAAGRKPTLTLTDAGTFRFVEPLECPTEEVVIEQRALEIVREPNLAIFVVGVIATAAGGIFLVRGLTDDAVSNPFTYGGAVSLGAGLPFAIGPWLGNGTELRPLGESAPVRRPGPAEPCGERALSAKHATLVVRGIEVFGTIDRDGTFAVSPFQLADAFEAATATAAWNIAARVEAIDGARTVDVLIDARAFAARAAAFLARGDFDAKIEAMRLVPGIAPGTLRVSLTTTADGAAARVVLAVKNDGPGPAYALRGHIAAPGTPALDGRIIYFGHVAKGASLSRELLIPLAATVADKLRNANVDVAIELRDAHGTAPATPVRFKGTVLVDAPR